MEDVVRVVRALSADTRLRVLKLLRGRDMSSAELQQALRVSRQTLSYHLSVLRTGGLVSSRREGRRVVYAAAVPVAADSQGMFERFLSHTLDDVN